MTDNDWLNGGSGLFEVMSDILQWAFYLHICRLFLTYSADIEKMVVDQLTLDTSVERERNKIVVLFSPNKFYKAADSARIVGMKKQVFLIAFYLKQSVFLLWVRQQTESLSVCVNKIYAQITRRWRVEWQIVVLFSPNKFYKAADSATSADVPRNLGYDDVAWQEIITFMTVFYAVAEYLYVERNAEILQFTYASFGFYPDSQCISVGNILVDGLAYGFNYLGGAWAE